MIRPGSESPTLAALALLILGLTVPARGTETLENPARGLQSSRLKGGRQADDPKGEEERFSPILEGSSAAVVRTGLAPSSLGASSSLRVRQDVARVLPSNGEPQRELAGSSPDLRVTTPGMLASVFSSLSDPAPVMLLMSSLSGLYFRGRLHRSLRAS